MPSRVPTEGRSRKKGRHGGGHARPTIEVPRAGLPSPRRPRQSARAAPRHPALADLLAALCMAGPGAPTGAQEMPVQPRSPLTGSVDEIHTRNCTTGGRPARDALLMATPPTHVRGGRGGGVGGASITFSLPPLGCLCFSYPLWQEVSFTFDGERVQRTRLDRLKAVLRCLSGGLGISGRWPRSEGSRAGRDETPLWPASHNGPANLHPGHPASQAKKS